MGVPPWIRTGGLSHHNALSTPGMPLGCHCPGRFYDTRFFDVMGLSAFSSLPLVGFCWTEEG